MFKVFGLFFLATRLGFEVVVQDFEVWDGVIFEVAGLGVVSQVEPQDVVLKFRDSTFLDAV